MKSSIIISDRHKASWIYPVGQLWSRCEGPGRDKRRPAGSHAETNPDTGVALAIEWRPGNRLGMAVGSIGPPPRPRFRSR